MIIRKLLSNTIFMYILLGVISVCSVYASETIDENLLDQMFGDSFEDSKKFGLKPSPEWKAHYDKGISYIANSNFKQALIEFSMATSLNNESGESYYHLGFCEKMLNPVPATIETFDTAIRLGKSSNAWYLADAYAHKGHILVVQKQYDEAISALNESLKLDKKYLAFLARGIAYHFKSEPVKSLQDLDMAISISDKDPQAWGYKAGSHHLAYLQKIDKDINKTAACQAANKACELGRCDFKQQIPDCK